MRTDIFVSSLVLLIEVQFMTTTSGTLTSDLYDQCPKGVVHEDPQQTSPLQVQFAARSDLDCAARCSQTADCKGVNVCPAGPPRQVSCTLTGGAPGQCVGLTAAPSPLCFHAQKVGCIIKTFDCVDINS